MRSFTVERVPLGLRTWERRWQAIARLGPHAWVVFYGRTKRGAIRKAHERATGGVSAGSSSVRRVTTPSS